jgi:hypothetical protein
MTANERNEKRYRRPRRPPAKQTIFRNASPRDPYTSILTSTLQDGELSAKAGWVLMLLLSMPPDWDVSLAWIAKRRKLGRDVTRNVVRELEDRGFVRLHQERRKDGTAGRCCYLVTDKPHCFGEPKPENQASVMPSHRRKPKPENQASAEQQNQGSPKPGFPAPENQSPTNSPDSDKEDHSTKKDVCPSSVAPAAKASHGQPSGLGTTDQAAASDGDVIPFDHVVDHVLVAADAKQANAKKATGLQFDYLGINKSELRRECSRRYVDPVEVLRRYHAEVERRVEAGEAKIRRPTAYAITIAQGLAAERDGITPADAKAYSVEVKAAGNQRASSGRSSAKRLGDALTLPLERYRRKVTGRRDEDGGSDGLMAALERMGAALKRNAGGLQ